MRRLYTSNSLSTKSGFFEEHIETDTNVGCKANEDKKCPESRKDDSEKNLTSWKISHGRGCS